MFTVQLIMHFLPVHSSPDTPLIMRKLIAFVVTDLYLDALVAS